MNLYKNIRNHIFTVDLYSYIVNVNVNEYLSVLFHIILFIPFYKFFYYKNFN